MNSKVMESADDAGLSSIVKTELTTKHTRSVL